MSMHTGNKTVATPGTRVALAASHVAASWITVQAFLSNTGPIYVGDSTVSYDSLANGKSYVGHILLPGDFCNLREMGGPTAYDLQNIYIDADNALDGCNFNYGRR